MAVGRCSFCDKTANEVDHLVAGPGEIAICPECVGVARELIASAQMQPTPDRVLTQIGLLVTNDPRRGGLLGAIKDAAVAIRYGQVTWVGPEQDLPSRYRDLPELRCGGRAAIPGWVDILTQLLGSEPKDFLRNQVDLSSQLTDRISRRLMLGTTTLVVTAGGADQPTDDMTALSLLARVRVTLPSRVEIGWQAVGSDSSDHRRFPVELGQMAGSLATFWLAPASQWKWISSYMSRSAPFPVMEVHERGEVAQWANPPVRAVVGLTDPSSADLNRMHALQLGAILTPTVSLRQQVCPARLVWDRGVTVAIASAADPDTLEVAGMGLVLALAIAGGGLKLGEALWAATRGAAEVLGRLDRGWLGLGSVGDVVVLDTDRLSDLVDYPDTSLIHRVVVAGDMVPAPL